MPCGLLMCLTGSQKRTWSSGSNAFYNSAQTLWFSVLSAPCSGLGHMGKFVLGEWQDGGWIKGIRRTFHLSLLYSLRQTCFLWRLCVRVCLPCVFVCVQVQAEGRVGWELNDSLSKWKLSLYLWPFGFFVQLFLLLSWLSPVCLIQPAAFVSAIRQDVIVQRIHSQLTFI